METRTSAARNVGFVHLNVRSAYSLREGALGIARLSKLIAADGGPAVALTDPNLFGALEFSEKVAAAGIQPIVGLRLALEFGDLPPPRTLQRPLPRPGVILLAQSETGYRTLMRLTSRAFLDPSLEEPHVAIETLLGQSEGLICLTGGPDGPIDRLLRTGAEDATRRRLEMLQGAFADRLYVELQRHGTEAERRVEPGLLDLAYRRGLPLVATNEVYFPAASDYEAHDALLCLAQGTIVADANRRRVTPEHRLKTRAEMTALFADLPKRPTIPLSSPCGSVFGRARASRSCRGTQRGRSTMRRTNFGVRLARVWRHASRQCRLRREWPAPITRRALHSSSTSSSR